eukprot:6202977-Pleurochrysis_carterae.AAC.1
MQLRLLEAHTSIMVAPVTPPAFQNANAIAVGAFVLLRLYDYVGRLYNGLPRRRRASAGTVEDMAFLRP